VDNEIDHLSLLEDTRHAINAEMDRGIRQLSYLSVEGASLEVLRERLEIIRRFVQLKEWTAQLVADFADGKATLDETVSRMRDLALQHGYNPDDDEGA
jgi:hypothetical protein